MYGQNCSLYTNLMFYPRKYCFWGVFFIIIIIITDVSQQYCSNFSTFEQTERDASLPRITLPISA